MTTEKFNEYVETVRFDMARTKHGAYDCAYTSATVAEACNEIPSGEKSIAKFATRLAEAAEKQTPKELWKILVPTIKDGKPIRTRYHKVWDKFVRSVSGGLTILTPAKGQWIHKETGALYSERMIPVEIACTEEQIRRIAEYTAKYYNQITVMAYRVSDKVIFYDKPNR